MRLALRRHVLCSSQRGVLVIMMVPLILVMLGLAALVVDIGRIMIVRNELQNAADAAALAGAGKLQQYMQPNWSAAELAAHQAVSLNFSEQTALVEGQVELGFWPVSGQGGLRPYDVPPATPQLGENPAVKVTISRSQDLNHGPLQFIFAPLLGFREQALTATAVSVITTPGFASAGTLFPMVLNMCMFNQFWANGAPLNPGQSIRIGSAYHYDNCSAGQWTSLDLFSQSARVAKQLLVDGNNIDLNVLDDTFIQSGTESSIYSTVQQMITANGGSLDVLMPVVDSPDLSKSVPLPIVAFAPFQITASVGGSGKYIEGKFIENYKAAGTSGGQINSGVFFGAITAAILVK